MRQFFISPRKQGARTLAIALASLAGVALGQPADFVPGRVLVKFRQDAGPQQVQAALAALAGRATGQIARTGVRLVSLPAVAAGNQSSANLSVLVGNASDTTPPAVSILSPANGATVKGTVAVSVSAADTVGVVYTELYVDGALVSTATAAPLTLKWNTKRAAASPHGLHVKAYDGAGNGGASSPIMVYK